MDNRASTIVIYSPKFNKYFGGNGWVDKLPYFLINRYDTQKEAQEVCDGMRLVSASFDREKAKLPEHEVCYVVDLITNEKFIPPEFTDNKYVLERQWLGQWLRDEWLKGVSSLSKTS